MQHGIDAAVRRSRPRGQAVYGAALCSWPAHKPVGQRGASAGVVADAVADKCEGSSSGGNVVIGCLQECWLDFMQHSVHAAVHTHLVVKLYNTLCAVACAYILVQVHMHDCACLWFDVRAPAILMSAPPWSCSAQHCCQHTSGVNWPPL
jgi:hypothetical protein